jgi:hypothetical protein
MTFASLIASRFAAGVAPTFGSERIAAVQRHILDRAALYGVARAEAPFGVGVALSIAVIARIRINQAADGAVSRRPAWV